MTAQRAAQWNWPLGLVFGLVFAVALGNIAFGIVFAVVFAMLFADRPGKPDDSRGERDQPG